jgi:BirA family biotin operon repressor/biotin-[acetyl-CoA-carboxylase] ligase
VAIRSHLTPTLGALPPAVHVLDQVDSTNDWLAQRAEHAPDGSACLAEQQLAGRGRRGRTWVSPFGRNLYLSLLWRLPTTRISGLSIAMGVTVADACESVGATGLSLKWPNDLVAASGKVGGILVDVETSDAESCIAIIGIGLNVDMPARLRRDITQPCADLNELAGRRISRNELAAALIEHGREALPRFAQEGLAPFQQRFATRDASRDHPVTVEEGGRISTGHARGIDTQGALMLETAEGITRIHSGDVSLRALS